MSDPELNYSDSWVSATQTVAETTVVNTGEAIIDPVSGQTTTQIILAEDPQQVPSLAGYGYDGRLRVTTGYAANDGIEISTVRQIDDATSDVDQAGVTSTIILDREPARELGTLVDAQVDVTTNSSGGFACNTDCTQVANRTPSLQRSSETGFTGSAITVAHLNETHVRVTEIWSARSMGSRPAQLEDPVVRQQRDYQKRGADWVLTRVRTHAKLRQGRSESEYVQNVTMSDVKWNRNPVEDAKRMARRESRAPGGSSALIPLPTYSDPRRVATRRLLLSNAIPRLRVAAAQRPLLRAIRTSRGYSRHRSWNQMSQPISGRTISVWYCSMDFAARPIRGEGCIPGSPQM